MSKIKKERGIESLNKESYKHKYAPRDRKKGSEKKKGNEKKKDTDTNTKKERI